MKKLNFYILTTSLIACSIICSAPVHCSSLTLPSRTQQDSTILNQPAPALVLHSLDGKTYVPARMKGKVIVLNFWFEACKPCVSEMPLLNAIKEKYDPGKVVFLALSLDNADAVNKFLKKHQFNFTIIPGAGKAADSYGVYAYPATVVIDAAGIVRFMQVGGPDIGQTLPRAIDAALNR